MSDQFCRILIVDDNPVDVLLIKEALKTASLDCEANVFSDGGKALASLKNWEGPVPDLVILDLGLPTTDGQTVLQAIRRNDRFSRVPVMITSGVEPPGLRDALKAFRVNDYFVKPMDLTGFLQIGPKVKELLKDVTGMSRQQPDNWATRTRSNTATP